MSSFDKTRFAEAFVAAILGGVAQNYMQDGQKSILKTEVARMYQRSLILAMNINGFTEEVSSRYLQRVGDLPPSKRATYMQVCLQPSENNFDERLSSVMIFDHALKNDLDWFNFLRAFSLDGPSNYEAVVAGSNSALNYVGTVFLEWRAIAAQEAKADKIRRSRTWYGRLGLWIDSLL